MKRFYCDVSVFIRARNEQEAQAIADRVANRASDSDVGSVVGIVGCVSSASANPVTDDGYDDEDEPITYACVVGSERGAVQSGITTRIPSTER